MADSPLGGEDEDPQARSSWGGWAAAEKSLAAQRGAQFGPSTLPWPRMAPKWSLAYREGRSVGVPLKIRWGNI